MKRCLHKFFVLLLFLSLSPLFAQNYARGAILDPVLYEQTDAKPVLLSRSYSSLPVSVSLKQYSPFAGNQNPYSTCVGWATAYAARTISESYTLERTDRTLSSDNVFSAAYIYKNISDNEGQNGANIGLALDFMKQYGVAKRQPFEETMAFENIRISMYNTAPLYPIADYVRLFSNPRGVPGTIDERVIPVKKSLAEGKPVIIGMNCPISFELSGYGGDLFEPLENPNEAYGGHAMCVVGYDDNMYGGAFEIQNSWSAYWGNEGYIWIRYQDFADWVYHAYEIIENLTNFQDAAYFAASIEIELRNDSRGMPVTFDRQGFYRTNFSYSAGTDFCFIMTNEHPAYVYAFSADNFSPNIERIFPLRGVSPILDYTDSAIAWPGEYEWMRLDNVPGTDYLVVLYAKEALDIDAIQRRFAAESGTFPQRVQRAVGADFIPYDSVEYNSNSIEFSAQSSNPKAVFGLLLAIDHR